MAEASRSSKPRKLTSSLIVNGVLILICLIWIIPTIGTFVTSFRNSQDIFTTGWWTVFPHRAYVDSGVIHIDPNANLDGPIAIPGYQGQYTFEQLRNGVKTSDGHLLTWYGNKRTRQVNVSSLHWVGFSSQLTTKNYTDVLSSADVTYLDANGNSIIRQGDNLINAFLNSVAVAVPSTIIPILIAALLVVPLQIALVPIVQDYTKLGLNGSYLAIWLAHTGFGLPLAVYLLFNYINTLPRDLLESAFIDGASNFSIFTKLILPLSIPALASFAIFQFLWVWNDYLVALVFLGSKNLVLTVTLANMVGEKGQDWQLLTSGAFISMILPLAVFFALQRYFVRGLMAGSIKG
jgi:alpha-glucoside transport system permease protein